MTGPAEADVVVIGGGPAGSCLAARLARQGASVALIERGTFDEPRVGETLGAEVGPLLDALGARDAVRALLGSQVPFRGVRSAWGSDALDERPSILHPLGDGWHVDRAAFDARLVAWAQEEGVNARIGVGPCRVAREGEGWAVSWSDGALRAGFLVDASGRGAPASQPIGGRAWFALDRQVALVAWLDAVGLDDPTLLLEAVPEGFWYSVPLPDGRLALALITDADLTPAGGRSGLRGRFGEALARSRHTRARVAGAAIDEVRVARADSGRLLPSWGPGFRAVGDACSASDPLGGNGVARALRDALDASRALEAPGDPAAIARGLDAYTELRGRYYAAEARFADAPFWARRHPLPWRDAPLWLAPDAPLAWVRPPQARVEAILPPRAIAAVRHALAAPSPAHAVMSRLREVAPLPERRLLVGLQTLCEEGAIRRA